MPGPTGSACARSRPDLVGPDQLGRAMAAFRRQIDPRYKSSHSSYCRKSKRGEGITSQDTTLLKVIHALARIALAQFLANKTRHHTAYPLLANDRVAGIVDCDVVLEVDAVVGRGDGGLFGQEGGGLGGGHFAEVTR